jgi:undecaprenyl-diphosphatase
VLFSVVVLYFKRFFQTWDFYFKLFVAFIPAVVLGLLFSDLIDELLRSHSCRFSLLGGIVLLKVDQWFNHSEDTKITYLTAFKILYQCLAMVPGVSKWRQHCGWNVSKLTRTSAAEFSFFLAVPLCLAQRQKNVTIITKMVLY